MTYEQINRLTIEEKAAEALRLQREIIGNIDTLRVLMCKEVLDHCEERFHESEGEDYEAASLMYFREDLQEYSRQIPLR